MNAVQTSNRLSQIQARIGQLQALKGQHEVRLKFIPRGVSEPVLYVQCQRDIIAGIDSEIARFAAERDALTQQGELFPV